MHFSGLNTLCSFTKYVTAEVSLGNVKFIFFYQRKILTLICYFNTTWIILSSWIRGPGKSWIEKSSSFFGSRVGAPKSLIYISSSLSYRLFEIGSLNLCDPFLVKSNLGPAWKKNMCSFLFGLIMTSWISGWVSQHGWTN